ncbi:MAG TPA: TVP38/TMEM64 family protein, partial [Gammaproteobacteria bacterium]|nr:TVP38/TMEM64 family protein [Gammaproteobacteria bacterium]
SLLTLSAGFVFGLPVGIALVSAGSTAGAACAFLLARFFARDWIAARTSHLPRFKALDSAVRHEGFVIVFLARLSPLFPFNLLNYGLGLTAVRFRDFLLATWLGILPSIVVSVYVGSLAQNLDTLAASFKGGFGPNALLALTVVATAALSVLISRKAKRTLALHIEKASAEAVEARPREEGFTSGAS